MGKKKIVVDTNILISALGWNGSPRELLGRIIDNEFDLYISIKQIAELKRVMDYPKFAFREEQKSKFLEIIYHTAKIVHTKIELNVADDLDDNMILECAQESGSEYIISGDDDLLRMKEFRDIKIVTVKEFLGKYCIF